MFSKYKYFIFSQNPDKLVKFYSSILGMKIIKQLKLPKDYGYLLEVSAGYELWIEKHSKVKGRNNDYFRHMLTLYTNEVEKYYNKVKNLPGIKVVQKPLCMSKFNPKEVRYVCTILDPDGNCLQFIGELK